MKLRWPRYKTRLQWEMLEWQLQEAKFHNQKLVESNEVLMDDVREHQEKLAHYLEQAVINDDCDTGLNANHTGCGHSALGDAARADMAESLYRAGFGYHFVADLFGVSHKAMRDWLLSHGNNPFTGRMTDDGYFPGDQP